jgi:signal transduction histidine kinase
LLCAVSAIFLIGRALSPVRRITNTVKNIEEKSDLTQRVQYNGPPDEIGQLAFTFNRMIEHLHRVFQSQKQFVADASHDMRIPLTVIKGNYDLLVRNPDRPDRMEALRAIGTETERMTDMANSLLALTRIEAGETTNEKPVPMHEILIHEYQRALQQAEKRKIMISRNQELYITGNELRLRQLLGNLVDNALKYTSSNVSLSLSRENGFACLSVSDDGIGITAEHLPHIFEPFYRSDQARSRDGGGFGLGLAIVKSIAEQHRGEIDVSSEPGKGTTFKVRFRL